MVVKIVVEFVVVLDDSTLAFTYERQRIYTLKVKKYPQGESDKFWLLHAK